MFRNKFSISPAVLIFLSGFMVISCAKNNTTFNYKESSPDLSLSEIKTFPKYKVGSAYIVDGKRYYPREDFSYDRTGIASWYGPDFHGKKTANGEVYNQNDLTAAHKTLPLPTLVEVTNLQNNRKVILRVNDRGPFVGGRILDVSSKGADLLGFKKKGTAPVRVRVLTEDSKLLKAYLMNKNSALVVSKPSSFSNKTPGDSTSSDNDNTLDRPVFARITEGKKETPKAEPEIVTWNDFLRSAKASETENNQELMVNDELEVSDDDSEDMSMFDLGRDPNFQQQENLDNARIYSSNNNRNKASNDASNNDPQQQASNFEVRQTKTQDETYTAPVASLPKPSSSSAATYTNVVFLQVGAFSDPKNARTNLDKLETLKYPVKIFPLYTNGKVLYRLQVGPFEPSMNTDSIKKEISNLGYSNIITIRK